MKSGGNTMRVAKIVAQQLKAAPASKQTVQQIMAKVRTYVTANKAKLLAEADTKYASDATKRAAQKAAINKLITDGPAKMRHADLPEFVKTFVSKHFTPAEYAAAFPAQVAPLPKPARLQDDMKLMNAVRNAGLSVLGNNCSDVKGVDCNKLGNVAANVQILKTVKWSKMGSKAKAQFKQVLRHYINNDAGLKANYPTVDDAFAQKVYVAAKFGTRVPPRRPGADPSICGKGTVLKAGKCVVKKGGPKPPASSKFWHISLSVGPTVVVGRTTTDKCDAADYNDPFPGQDMCKNLNVMDLMGFSAGVSVMFRAGPVNAGFGIDYRYSATKPPESDNSSGSVGKTHNIALKGRIEYNLLPWLMIGAGLGFGLGLYKDQDFAKLGSPKSMPALTFDMDVVAAVRLKAWKSLSLWLQLKPFVTTALRPGFTRQKSVIPGSDVTGHPKSTAYGAGLDFLVRF